MPLTVFFKLEKKSVLPQKESTSQIVVNGYVCVVILILSLKSSKQKQKGGPSSTSVSHTENNLLEVRAGPEINTFITDNRHLIKKEHC